MYMPNVFKLSKSRPLTGYLLYSSDSETDSSEMEDSDSETLDNSSRTGSFEDCSGDVLGWKGFEMVRDDSLRGNPISSSKSNVGILGKIKDFNH